MRIVGFVCYFLILFYGVELVVEEFTIEEPAIHSPAKSRPSPIKETVENSRICVYYPTYKSCTDLPQN
ncbi:MAG TPA: hypothetical protein DEB37_04990 [Lysinibacillus sp.]|uniref:Uncharacterized protein n=1 Tax=Lysinibacillus fusiformis TaxID=28031 RepID=A0A2I0V049_9BACI|nr:MULTISPECIES: hypothetical protein [Lysinibacillus]HBT71633.1 hypothetical protein [Lysinibacillus sp.]KUF33601.1 hypothetical protein AK833_10730 [Lysinibacillus sp. F5]MEE3806312.1 hypothetical protein [Lysinibacillus fusiformis]PKU51670.1 hypothetical protein CRI88_13355 [Lysinibacillus fusiformis]WCH45948.1 hypothetical protein NV349_12640 [Lysinibacillus sp. OF-1]